MHQMSKNTAQANVKSIVPDRKAQEKTLLGRLPKPITTIRKEGNKLLSQLLDTCFSNIDDTLFDLAKNAVKQEDQDDYFLAMRELRSQKKSIIKTFVDGINSSYSKLAIPSESGAVTQLSSISVNDLAVVANEALDEIVALESIASRAQKRYEHQIHILATRINSVVPAETDPKYIPVSPNTLCSMFSTSVKTVNISTKATLVLFKLYEHAILDNLGQLYQLMNTLLIERGILPDASNQKIVRATTQHTTTQHSGPMHDGTGGLHMPVEGFDLPLLTAASMSAVPHSQFTSSAGLSSSNVSQSSATIFDIMAQQQFASQPELSTPKNYLRELRKALNPGVGGSGEANLNVSVKERNLVGILDRLFTTVDSSADMAPPVKSLFQHLQMPLAKIALNDQSFFSNPNHSARKLLNTLSAAAIKFDGVDTRDLASDPLYQHMQKTVQDLLNIRTPSSEDFTKHLSAFSQFSEQETQKEALLEKQLIRAEQGRIKSRKVEKLVENTIREVCQGMDIRFAVNEIIHTAWKKVMVYTVLKYGEDSDQWDDAFQTLIELVTGTQSFANEADLSQANESLKALKTKITEGLLNISYDAFKTTKLIKSLELTFDELCRSISSLKSEEKSELTQAETLTSSILGTPSAVVTTQNIAVVEVITETAPEISSAFYAQAKNLSRGTWFDFYEENKKIRCRLAAIIAPHEQFIFVTNTGQKVASINLEEVAYMLQEQNLVYLDSNHIFDSALEQVISGLKRTPKQAR